MDCRETISYWPEFVLPYPREPLETYEEVLVEHLNGASLRESSAKIAYDPRTVSRWIHLALSQALVLVGRVIPCILRLLSETILPLSASSDWEAAQLLMAWLRALAQGTDFPRFDRLMGLCNLHSEGAWDLWGGPLGNAKSRVKETSPPG
ncbi:hypothetical protein [Acididesulfobacillus acetoxydans]|uniref:hypothetical protein n=1 Tax=Acididesulfobacillus acetoxydans TaxID=1561005 RepID=UPI001F0D6983|nr:hypothetical protein [Acididesulfobacillus acetoxydans]